MVVVVLVKRGRGMGGVLILLLCEVLNIAYFDPLLLPSNKLFYYLVIGRSARENAGDSLLLDISSFFSPYFDLFMYNII